MRLDLKEARKNWIEEVKPDQERAGEGQLPEIQNDAGAILQRKDGWRTRIDTGAN
jgi:hypothetical protein